MELEELEKRAEKYFAELEKQFNKYFGVRRRLNKEKVKFLQEDTTLKEEVCSIRKDFNITNLNPNLFPDGDFIDFNIAAPLGEEDFRWESNWLRSLPKAIQKKFDKRLTSLLKKLGLPASFHNILKYYILYSKFDYSYIGDAIFDYDWLTTKEEAEARCKKALGKWHKKTRELDYYKRKRFFEFIVLINFISNIKASLTTGERKFLRGTLRGILELNPKGKASKKLRLIYKECCKKIDKLGKNKFRKLRNFKIGMKALRFNPRVIESYNHVEEKNIKTRISLRNLSEKMVDEKISSPTKEDYRKNYQNLRKIKERIKKQMEKRFKKEK